MLPQLLAQGSQAEINLSLPVGSQFYNVTQISVQKMVSYAINIILVIAAILFFFLLVLGGIKWITSGGDKGQTEAARAQITAAFIGLLIVFAAWAVVGIVGTFFNVNLLGNFDINP